jgi:hypothetical protein
MLALRGSREGGSMTSTRRFPPPWQVEQIPGGFKVLDANGQAVAYVYARETREQADIAKAVMPPLSSWSRKCTSRVPGTEVIVSGPQAASAFDNVAISIRAAPAIYLSIPGTDVSFSKKANFEDRLTKPTSRKVINRNRTQSTLRFALENHLPISSHDGATVEHCNCI